MYISLFKRKYLLSLMLSVSVITLVQHAFCEYNGPHFNFVALHTSKCIDVPGNASTNNLQLQQWDCNSGAQQKFSFGGDKINKMGSQLKLRATGTTNGSAVVQSTSNPDSWRWEIYSNGIFRIRHNTTNKCIDVGGWNNGSPIQIWDCGGPSQTNQQFYFEPVGGHYYLRPYHSGQCLDIEGNASANNARGEQDICNVPSVWSQQWKLLPIPSAAGLSVVLMARHSGKVLDLQGGSFANGTAIQQYSYTGGINQSWRLLGVALTPSGEHLWNIYPINNLSKCVDIEGGAQSAGANAQLWDCLGTSQNNQLFTLLQN
jgi:hypothetical protein